MNIEVLDAQRSARDQELVMVQVEDGLRQARRTCSSRSASSRNNYWTASSSISNNSVSFGRMLLSGGLLP